MKVLFIGEIVSKAGVFTVKKLLPGLIDGEEDRFCHSQRQWCYRRFRYGKEPLPLSEEAGNRCHNLRRMRCTIKRTWWDLSPKPPSCCAPPTIPREVPEGAGASIQVGDQKIGVINLLGQSGYQRVHLSNPFSYVPDLVKRLKEQTDNIIVNFHATTTAERQTLAYVVDGTVSAMIGTGTKALTADAGLMKKGTARITDAGRTGSLNSVGGLDPEIEIRKFLTQIPERSGDTWDRLELQGVLLDLDEKGRALSIETLRIPCQEAPNHDTADHS